MSLILLDTHVFIWYTNGDKELSKSACKIIDVAYQNNSLYLAAISLWEISMLDVRKRIILEMPCLEWINKALELTHTQVIALTPSIATDSCFLPGKFHEDPADRLIVASARVEGLTLLTRDTKILAYGHSKYVSTMKV